MTLLKWALIAAVISLIAGAFGFGGLAAGSAGVAKFLFGLFLVIALVLFGLVALGARAVTK